MNFIGLYDINRLCWSDGFELAIDFFDLLGEKPNSFFYKEIVPLEQQDLDDGDREVSLADLEKVTSTNKELCGIGISLIIEEKDSVHWRANFHYFQDALYPHQKYLIVEYVEEFMGFDNRNFIVKIISNLSSTAEVPYGFACKLPSSGLRSYDYIDAQTFFAPMFNYENPSLWKLEVPSYKNNGIAPKRYLKGMMRLVYPYNFITTKHLNNKIQNSTLKNWIINNSNNGDLIEITDDLWIWCVDEVNLERVNLDCLIADILISGKMPSEGSWGP